MVDSGHLTIAEQIDHTGATYEQMIEQLSQQQVKLGQAAHLRDQFFFVRGEVEEALKTAKDQLHFVNAPGVSTPAKLDRYKVGYSEWLSTRQIAENLVDILTASLYTTFNILEVKITSSIIRITG